LKTSRFFNKFLKKVSGGAYVLNLVKRVVAMFMYERGRRCTQ